MIKAGISRLRMLFSLELARRKAIEEGVVPKLLQLILQRGGEPGEPALPVHPASGRCANRRGGGSSPCP